MPRVFHMSRPMIDIICHYKYKKEKKKVKKAF